MTHPLELYSAYLDGRTLSGVEIETLRKWLKDERNLAEFIEFAILHAAVMDRLKLGQLLEDLASRRGSEVVAPRMLADAIRDIEMHSPRVVVPMPKSQAQAPPQRSPAAPLLQHVVTVAASIAIFCGSAWMLWKFLEWRLRWAIRPLHRSRRRRQKSSPNSSQASTPDGRKASVDGPASVSSSDRG